MEQKLETFLVLCRTLHYGRAAEQLHLSQPAVSKHIQPLESQYGVQLFSYTGRRLTKTRQGKFWSNMQNPCNTMKKDFWSNCGTSPAEFFG